MEFEIWASDSGNRLFASRDLNETLAWALDYWLREGDEALEALSVGDELDRSRACPAPSPAPAERSIVARSCSIGNIRQRPC